MGDPAGGPPLAVGTDVETSTPASRGLPDGATQTDPVLAALARIEARITRLEARLDGIDEHVTDVRNAAAVAVDSIDGKVAALSARGVDVDARLHRALALLETLTDPAVLDGAQRLAQRLPELEAKLALLDQVPAFVAIVTDVADGVLGRLASRGIDLDARLVLLGRAAERLTSPEALALLTELLEKVEVIDTLLTSGVLDTAPVHVVGRMGQALAATASEQPPPVGPFAALRALSDGRIQRALGFGLRFAMHFGAGLHPKDASRQLGAG